MDNRLLENRKNGANAPAFNLREAKIESKIQDALNKVDEKDWYRAATCKSGALASSMMRKITDERKKIGRAIALLYFGFDVPEVTEPLVNAGVLSSDKKKRWETRGGKRYENLYKYTRDMVNKWSNDNTTDTDFEGDFKSYEEFDSEDIKDLTEMMKEEIQDLPSFKAAVEKNPEIFKDKELSKNLYSEVTFKDTFNKEMKNLARDRDYYHNSYDSKKAFGGKEVFKYYLMDDAKKDLREDQELLDYVAKEFEQGSGFGSDSDHIVPRPVMEYLHYKSAIKEFFERDFGIKLLMPQYFNNYNVERLWEYADDESAWKAGDLRNDPMFSTLLIVSRKGITFRDSGARKMWYDFSKQIAEAMGLPFNCKEKF